ncbi:HK97 family phage prohead protease [Hymenobacter sp. UYCo722]|uniref:HK97 family phage prohead protease n=1 Tax=Hymenobacter sp. UYCo722 TaxID=3156335 RepID=UPI0033953101
MSKQIEYKDALAGKVMDVDTTGRRVVLYGAAFDSMDSHRDTIQSGSFAKTIAETKGEVPYLMHHDPKLAVGLTQSLEEDGYGLKAISLVSDTQLGRDCLTLINDKVLTQNSIGYKTHKYAPNNHGGRTLQELQLVEISTVTFASNPDAKVLGIKAAVQQLLEQEAVLQKALRTGQLADETYLYLEEKQIELKSAILDLLEDKPLEKTDEPEAETPTTLPAADEPEVKQAVEIASQWPARFWAAYSK